MEPLDDLEIQRTLGEKELQIFNAEVQRQQKSVAVMYLLWFFLGWAGVHKFYLGKGAFGVTYALLSIGGYVLLQLDPGSKMLLRGETPMVFGVLLMAGISALLIWGLMMLWDLFTIPMQVSRQTAQTRRVLLRRLAPGASSGS